MILPFKTYLSDGKVERQSRNMEQAKSFLARADRRVLYVELQAINDENAEFVYEDIYEAIREGAQALMAKEGYKPLSHEATIAFLHDEIKVDAAITETFDSYRKLRNKVVYEAAKISTERVAESLIFAKEFIRMIKSLLAR